LLRKRCEGFYKVVRGALRHVYDCAGSLPNSLWKCSHKGDEVEAYLDKYRVLGRPRRTNNNTKVLLISDLDSRAPANPIKARAITGPIRSRDCHNRCVVVGLDHTNNVGNKLKGACRGCSAAGKSARQGRAIGLKQTDRGYSAV